jgi:hypothetical protein
MYYELGVFNNLFRYRCNRGNIASNVTYTSNAVIIGLNSITSTASYCQLGVYLGYEILNGVTHSINYSVVIGGNSLNSFWEPSTPTKVMIHLLWLLETKYFVI